MLSLFLIQSLVLLCWPQTKGKGEQYEERIVTVLRGQGIEPEVRHTTPEDSGCGLAQQAKEEHLEKGSLYAK
jgi:hypothetical protein